MSVQVSAALVHAPSPCSETEINRPSANFHPNIWGDYFLSYASNFENTEFRTEHQKLKEQVRQILVMAVSDDKPIAKLDLVDSVQRLGVSYHFEEEIDAIILQQLQALNSKSSDHEDENDDTLYCISLRFRLLRQHGYKILCDMFEKFKDDQGNFKESLIQDVKGLLSLYEATQLRVHGEDILEEALAFATTHLRSIAASNSASPLSKQISHALRQSIHKNVPRLEARKFMCFYQEDPSHNQVLLRFAKLDFNILQQLHRRELSEIARWWNDLDVPTKLPFARDRVAEGYFWILGVYFEPQYLLARKILTRVISMTSILDDIYDAHGTIEELELLAQAIDRWDVSEMKNMPEYMKVFYEALLNVYNEIEDMLDEGKSYRVHYAKEGLKDLARAYLIEANWFHRNYVPTMEEYMPNALVTSGYSLLTTTSFVGMGDIVTKETFDWILSKPKMISAASIVCRLSDDIMSHEFEQKRGHVASSVECYMKQHNARRQEAVDEFYRQISESWKDMNEECLYPTSVPMPLLTRIINLARVMDVAYKDGDGYTFAEVLLKDSVTSLLVDPVPL